MSELDYRCTHCGSVNSIEEETSEYFICATCGTKVIKKQSNEMLKAIKEYNLEATAHELKNYRDILSKSIHDKNGEIVTDVATKILSLLPNDFQANFYIKLCNRIKYPQDYESFLSSIINHYDIEEIIDYIDTIINNASFNELRIIEDIINHYHLDNSYKDKLNNRKEKIEEENDLYSNITRDVFICHSSKDKELLSKIVNYLENNEGYNTWYSERNMPWNPLNYWDNIKEAIKNCKVFLLLITENSKHSIDVRKELSICKELNILNRVALISDTENPGIEIRQFLSETGSEWIDIKSDNALEVLSKRIYDLKDRVIDNNEDNSNSNSYINSLIKRAEKLIDQKKYAEAKDKIEEVLDNDNENSKAYILLCLIDLGLTKEEELEKQITPLTNNENFNKALEYANSSYKKILLNYQNKILKKIEYNRLESFYNCGLKLVADKHYNEAIEIFSSILTFKNSKEILEECKIKKLNLLYERALTLIDDKEYDKAIDLLNSIIDYKDSLEKKDYVVKVRQELENKYQSALNKFNNNEYQEALTLFNTIKDYRDSNNYINQCNDLILKEEKYQNSLLLIKNNVYSELRKAYKLLLTIKDYKDSNELINKLNEIIKKNHKKKINFSISIITGFVIISLLLIFLVFIPSYKNKQYNSGIDLLTNGNYEEAIKILDGLDYKESNKYYYIALACKAFEDDDYEKGINTLTSIGISTTINYDNSDCDVSITSEEINSINDITCIASKVGYKFINWNYESYQLDVKSNIYTLILKPIFNSITYFITYDLDGGTAENENDYTIEEEVKLINPEKEHYTFIGWTGTGLTKPTLNVTINKGSIGDRNYKANYTINSYTITFDTDGGSTINSITQEYGSTIIAPAYPTKTDYIFTGWDTPIPSTMPASNLTIKALWVKIYVENDKTYMEFGSFPQTHVSDATLINNLNALTTTNANGYYEYEGYEYYKVTATPDDTKVTSVTSWFKVEPIKWRVLYTNNSEYTLLSEYLLIAKIFDDDSNDYLKSELRKYLTGDFYSKAFTTNEKSLIQSNINVNNDKIWLLSLEEVCNTTYGFDDNETKYDTNRRAKPTDYALATGAYFYSKYDAGSWWLRTPNSSNSNDEYYVYYSGSANYLDYVYDTNPCARPALLIKINQENQ